MERIGKILLIAGLVLLLTAPALALANDRPMVELPCCKEPVVDAKIDQAYLDCGVEFTLERGERDSMGEVEADHHLFGRRTGGGGMALHSGDFLYIIVGECWQQCTQGVDDGGDDGDRPVSLLLVKMEDDLPLGMFNAQFNSSASAFAMADEGDFQYLGFLDAVAFGDQIPENYMFVQGWTESQFVGMMGGEQPDPHMCLDGVIKPAPGSSAFAGYFAPKSNTFGLANEDEEECDLYTVTEVAIPLNGPLNCGAGGAFNAAIGTASTRWWFDVTESSRRKASFWWPNDYKTCLWDLMAPYADNGYDCDMPLACYGRVNLGGCPVEFVPEPGSILLLGSGLMGLAGYAGLRLRKRP